MPTDPAYEAWKQAAGADRMDWQVIRFDGARVLSRPDEGLEAFLVRVGVPPAYRLDVSSAQRPVWIALEPSFDLASGTWIWSIAANGPRRQVLKSWTMGPATTEQIAAEVLADARHALAVPDDEAIHLYASQRPHWPPFGRIAGETVEAFLQRAIDTRRSGRDLEIGVGRTDGRPPAARLSFMSESELTMEWITPLIGGGRPRWRIDAWPSQPSGAIWQILQEIGQTFGPQAIEGIVIWQVGEDQRNVALPGDEVETIRAVVERPTIWRACTLEAPGVRATLLPLLGRSGPGSGMDEITSSKRPATDGPPARLHLRWWGPEATWHGHHMTERIWVLPEPTIDEVTAREVGVAVREILELPEGERLQAEGVAVASPDYFVAEEARSAVLWAGFYATALGVVVGVALALAVSLGVGSGNDSPATAWAFVCGALSAVVAGVATLVALVVGSDALSALTDAQMPNPAARARFYGSPLLRTAVAVTSFAIPALAGVLAAFLVAGASSSP